MTSLHVTLLALLLSLLLTLTTLAICSTLRPNATCRDAATIPPLATIAINSHISSLVNSSTFFSVFEVALEKSCPFWPADATCVIRDCSVHNCSDAEVPPAWRESCSNSNASPTPSTLHGVDRSRTGLAALVGDAWWLTADSAAWVMRDAHEDAVFVDLRRNPERYTGYAGPRSAKVWQAIYDENCFAFSSKCRSGICAPGTCKEQRVLYRLISGLHASISMHIAKEYPGADNVWGVNTSIYKHRIRQHPERIANLNVAYALVLRAVGKAAGVLHPANYSYSTGHKQNDLETRERLETILQFPQLQTKCQTPAFDESDMFLHEHHRLLPEFRRAFRNISMIMDCVGCEKCRLWGKLQFLGLGTALRILFEPRVPDLERNDVIALVNLLHKLSSSVIWVDKMEDLIKKEAMFNLLVGATLVMFTIVIVALSCRNVGPRQKKIINGPAVSDGRKADVDTSVQENSVDPSLAHTTELTTSVVEETSATVRRARRRRKASAE